MIVPMDFFSALGTTALVTLLIGVVGVLLGLLVVILVIREGVSQGLRSHQLWLEKTGRSDAGSGLVAITPPSRTF